MGRPTTSLGEALARNGAPTLLGSIVATTTTNNSDTAVPFNATGAGLAGMYLRLEASAACQFKFGTLATVTAVTSDESIAANSYWEGWAPDGAAIGLAVVGNATVKVYRKQ